LFFIALRSKNESGAKMKRYSNKNELQGQLIAIYNNFKNGNISNRQLKKANNIINILKSINDFEIERELEKYIYDNRLKSKLYVKASKPSMKCHLKYAFNYPTKKVASKKQLKKVVDKIENILQDDFNNELNLDGKIKNLSKKMASMQKLNNMQKIAKM
jgi:hypothetical protein